MNAAGWVVAGYAAVVSTASLAWQVVSWHLARRNRVTVTIAFALVGLPQGTLEAIAVNVVNRSDHTVRVAGAGLYLQDGSQRQFQIFHPPEGATIPGPVASHDSGETYMPIADARATWDVDVFAPLTGWVRLATGETVESKPTTLRSRN